MALYLGSNSVDMYAGWPPTDWKGRQVTKIKDLDVIEYTLASTNYATWDPSTTAKNIRSASNVTTFTANMADYEYLMRWRCRIDVAYNSGVTPISTPHVQMQEIWQGIFRRPDTVTKIGNGTFDTTLCATLFTAPLMIYYNSSGNDARYYSTTYGLYASAAAAAISSTSSDTPTITIKVPQLNARCNDTYFTTTMARNVDQTNSKFKLKCEVYQMEIDTSTIRSLYDGLIDLYQHGI